MMPRKVILRRDQSAGATCQREISILYPIIRCGAVMQLVVTRNPIGALPYDELVITRCLAGHLADSRGVLQEENA